MTETAKMKKTYYIARAINSKLGLIGDAYEITVTATNEDNYEVCDGAARVVVTEKAIREALAESATSEEFWQNVTQP